MGVMKMKTKSCRKWQETKRFCSQCPRESNNGSCLVETVKSSVWYLLSDSGCTPHQTRRGSTYLIACQRQTLGRQMNGVTRESR